MREGRDDINRGHADTKETSLGKAQATASTEDARRMVRVTRIGACLSVPPHTTNGTELGDKVWDHSLFLRYVIDNPELPYNCDCCGVEFYICHTLECKNGGLITARHIKLCAGVSDLVNNAFTLMHVHDDPILYMGCNMRGGKENLKGSPSKDKGELNVVSS